MTQLATAFWTGYKAGQAWAGGPVVRPVPCAEIRAAEVRELYRQRFPHEWVAVETAVLLGVLDCQDAHFYVSQGGVWTCQICGLTRQQ